MTTVANEVRRVVDELIARPRVAHGADTHVVAAAEGSWKIKMYKDRGSWSLRVVTPSGITLYSRASVMQFLDCLSHDGLSHDEPPRTTTMRSGTERQHHHRTILQHHTTQHLHLCASRIALGMRAWFLRRCTHRVRSSTYAVERAMRSLREVRSTREAAAERLENTTAVHLHPEAREASHPTTVHDDDRSPTSSPWSLIVEPTTFTRDHVGDACRAEIQAYETPQDTHSYRCSKAILRTPHYPLLVGTLPALATDARYVLRVQGNPPRYVHVTEGLSRAHEATLAARFRPKWVAHVRTMVRTRPADVLDLYADRSFRRYLGSVVVERLLARRLGKPYPIVSIECLVSARDQSDAGRTLVEICRGLLFADDVPSIRAGGLVAQCLPKPFWEFLMEPTKTAQCLVRQMHMLYASYDYEDGCTMRFVEVNLDDPGYTRSPHKMEI